MCRLLFGCVPCFDFVASPSLMHTRTFFTRMKCEQYTFIFCPCMFIHILATCEVGLKGKSLCRLTSQIRHHRITEVHHLFYLEGQPYPYLDSIIFYHRRHKLCGMRLKQQVMYSCVLCLSNLLSSHGASGRFFVLTFNHVALLLFPPFRRHCIIHFFKGNC